MESRKINKRKIIPSVFKIIKTKALSRIADNKL
jgi:hypothetical protein